MRLLGWEQKFLATLAHLDAWSFPVTNHKSTELTEEELVVGNIGDRIPDGIVEILL